MTDAFSQTTKGTAGPHRRATHNIINNKTGQMENIFWGSAKSWLMHSKLIDQSTKSNYSRHGGSQIIEGEKSKNSEITKKGDRDRQRKTVWRWANK